MEGEDQVTCLVTDIKPMVKPFDFLLEDFSMHMEALSRYEKRKQMSAEERVKDDQREREKKQAPVQLFAPVWSPPFSSGLHTWRLRIYPTGIPPPDAEREEEERVKAASAVALSAAASPVVSSPHTAKDAAKDQSEADAKQKKDKSININGGLAVYLECAEHLPPGLERIVRVTVTLQSHTRRQFIQVYKDGRGEAHGWPVFLPLSILSYYSVLSFECMVEEEPAEENFVKRRWMYANGVHFTGFCRDDGKPRDEALASVAGEGIGTAEGFGIQELPGGARAAGIWVNGVKHGMFCETYPNGDRFVGLYQNGKRNGYGIFSYLGQDEDEHKAREREKRERERERGEKEKEKATEATEKKEEKGGEAQQKPDDDAHSRLAKTLTINADYDVRQLFNDLSLDAPQDYREYRGRFSDGDATGSGVLVLRSPIPLIYEGEVRQTKRHGKGTLYRVRRVTSASPPANPSASSSPSSSPSSSFSSSSSSSSSPPSASPAGELVRDRIFEGTFQYDRLVKM